MSFFLRGGGGGGGGGSFGDALNDALGTLNQLVGDGGRGPPRPPPRGGYDNTGRDPLAGLADQLGGLGGLGGLAGLAGLGGFGGGRYSDWGSIKDRYFRPRPKPPQKPRPPMSFGDIVGKTKGAYHFINRLLPKTRDPSISNPALLPFALVVCGLVDSLDEMYVYLEDVGDGGSTPLSPFDDDPQPVKETPSHRTAAAPRTATRLPSLAHLAEVGEKGSGIRARGEVQDFHKIQAQCLSEGVLWEDPNFPAVDSSIFYTRGPPKPFEWRRPGEITGDPQFMVGGASRFDIQQGELGDCWLLAAVANLTLHDDLFFQVVPHEQGFEDNYCGIFHFRFWQYGRWLDVVIDDRLPTVYGELVFLHSSTKNEFWSALLEKAYAKLHGSYEALKGGTTCEGMEDFTGGVTEMYELREAPGNLYKILLKAYERSSLMACSIEPDPHVTEARTSSGLVKGHAYSITRVQYVDVQTPRQSGRIPLIRLRNPWGNEAEWNGPWSDQSPEWRLIPDHEKEEIGLIFDDDGEFWMSYQDFLTHFTQLEMCNLSPDSMEDDNIKKWEANTYEGEWVRGVTAGGCRNYLDTFWHNPQYRITLTDVDEDDDENRCTVIVALMQKNRRAQRKKGMECLTVGFAVYNLGHDPDSLPKPLDYNFFKYNASCARSPSFINLREVSCRFKLPPGSYCIVPSTFEPNEQGEFILRVYSEKRNNMEEHDEEVGIGHIDPRVKDEDEDTEMAKKDEKVKGLFLKLAGEDGEVDWMELKEIMDYTMRNELPSRPRPPTQHQVAPMEDDTLVGQLVNLLCGVICKDTPLGTAFASGGDQGHAADTRSSGFAKEVCRSMVAMMDADHSGKLGYEEFKILWTDIRRWRAVFKLYCKEGSGFLSAFELRQALNSAGYRLNNHILNILFHRYGASDGTITFDDFMMCAIRMKTMIDLFRERDPDNTNSVSFTLEEWMEKTLYS